MTLHCTMTELRGLVRTQLGESKRRTMTQDDIDDFARLTGDKQWIHIDQARAADSPFGSTIIHGYLTLALLGQFWGDVLKVTDSTSVLNYGLDRVRFLSPVPVLSRLYMTGTIVDVRDIRGALRLYAEIEIRVEGQVRPAVAATSILQFSC